MATAVQEKQQTYNKSDFKYVPMIQQRPLDMKFHYYREDGTLDIIDNYKLIKSVEELKEFAKSCVGKVIAVDTETTGLTYCEDRIVGFSISLDAYSGIYVPIRHKIRREEKVKVAKKDENGNILYTKAGKPRQQTVSQYYYFEQPENLPDRECLDILYEIMLNAKCSLLHKSEFDLNMIKSEGYDVTKLKTFDTIILPYIYDAEGRKVAGLKEVSSLLGRKQPTFKETVGDEGNFQFTIPSQSYKYASVDSCCTYYIYQNLYPMVKKLLSKYTKTISLENGKPYDIIARDNELIRAFVDYYGHVDIEVDTPVAEAYRDKIIEDLKTNSEKVYSYFDKGIFSLSTGSKEFKTIMEEFHVVTGAFTDKGAISYGKKGIEAFARNMRDLKFILENFDTRVSYDLGGHIDKRADIVNFRLASILEIYAQPYFKVMPDRSPNSIHITSKTGSYIEKEAFKELLQTLLEKETEKLEILKCIQKIASLNKALNSYIDKLTKVDHCKMKYKLQGTTSGRLASGNGSKNDKKKNHYYIDLNAQNLTKPNPAFYLAEKCDDENDPENILGYKFTLVSDEFYHKHKDDEDKIIVEGAQPIANIRKCMKAGYQDIYYYKEIDDENGTEEDIFYTLNINGKDIQVTKDTVINWGNIRLDTDLEKIIFLNLFVHELKKELLSNKPNKHRYVLKEVKDNRELTHYTEVKHVPRYCLSLDYSSQEYIVLADISRDSLMLDNFYKGIDPHEATAVAIWGRENYDKHKRRKAKSVNFLCIDKNTYVLTNNGYKTPDTFNINDKIIDFNGKEQSWSCALTEGEIIKVRFSNGITEGFTPNHKVRILDGTEILWKEVKDLTEKDNILQYGGGCLRVMDKQYTVDDIFVLETERHVYSTRCTCSHNCNYMGTAPTLAQNMDIPLEEARELIEQYEKAYWECIQWKKSEINKMYKQGGVCYTVFGRPRQFASRLKMADQFQDEKVSERLIKACERRVPNHIIQGTCGDILRWVLIKLYRKYFKQRDPHIDFLNTVHDEVNYSVDRRYAVEYARDLQDLMKFDILNPKLPIETSIDVGTSYGQVFPFKWADKERTKLIPKRA